MKKLAIISITLFILSGSLFANSSGHQPIKTTASETTPFISFTMIKEAFKFGFQSGWMVKQ